MVAAAAVAAVQAGDTEAGREVGGTAGRFAGYTGLVPRHRTALAGAALAGSLGGFVRIAEAVAGSPAAPRSHHQCRAGRHLGAFVPGTRMIVSTGSRRTTEHIPGKLVQ